PALRATFLGRDARLADDDRRLAEYQSAPPVPPGAPAPAASPGATPPSAPVTLAPGASTAAFSIRPPAGSPSASRLATDGRRLGTAFEPGRAATHAAFAPSTP